MEIIERILMILEQKNKRMVDLTRYLNLNTSTTSNWKTKVRNPPSEYIYPICEFLEVSTEYLLTGKETKKEPSSPQLNEDESELLNLFQQLDKRGKTKALNACYDEIDRMKQEQAATTAFNQNAG